MNNQNIETITHQEKVLALIIHKDFHVDGVQFFTPEDFPQQLGFISHPAGTIIEAHIHRKIKREVSLTQEVLIVRKGKIQVNLYAADKKYLDSRILTAGDVMLLTGGGHGYKVLEDLDMIEIKQGPYLGEQDKIRFQGIE